MNYEQMNNNKVFLTGEIINEPEFSHETFGEAFYEVSIRVKRLSDACDIIPITISEKLLNNKKFGVGKEISIRGQFRSFNKLEDNHSKLMLNVFVREICEPMDDLNTNAIEICGYICKEPIYRMTPFKREICDILVAVNRAYNKSDYLPCITWGRNAKYIKEAKIGDKVSLVGRIQSREYQKKSEDGLVTTKTAYEISVGRITIEGESQVDNEQEVM